MGPSRGSEASSGGVPEGGLGQSIRPDPASNYGLRQPTGATRSRRRTTRSLSGDTLQLMTGVLSSAVLPAEVARRYPYGYAVVDVETCGLRAMSDRVLQVAITQMA